jgi:hypothetical protein
MRAQRGSPAARRVGNTPDTERRPFADSTGSPRLASPTAGAACLRSPVWISVNNCGGRTRRDRINNTRKNKRLNSSFAVWRCGPTGLDAGLMANESKFDPEANMIIAIVLLTVSTVIAVAAVALWLDAPAAAIGDRAIDD